MEISDKPDLEFTWMSIRALYEDGSDANSQWFVDGILPNEGQEVKIVFVGCSSDGSMKLMLKAG